MIINTIGHSTHSTREFIKILKAHGIKLVVDIRHYPGSRHCPQFGKSRLKRNLERNHIEYIHIVELGGRRKPDAQSSLNAGWRSPQFRGYADYMQTEDFKHGLRRLISLGRTKTTVIMCSEALPWRCHRSLVADALIIRKISVFDIYSPGKLSEHFLSPFANVQGKHVTYPACAA